MAAARPRFVQIIQIAGEKLHRSAGVHIPAIWKSADCGGAVPASLDQWG
jgi:hypothetical protein